MGVVMCEANGKDAYACACACAWLDIEFQVMHSLSSVVKKVM
jgi:hypothetical protein